MPIELVPRNFDQACLPLVSAFDCGQDKFGKLATDWIRCVDPLNCAIQAIRDRQTQVFLYNNLAGELVGFGSLGKTTRKLKKVEEEWSIVPHFGIAIQLRGLPAGAMWQDRYAASIMGDLMSLARDHQTPTLMLKVHQENTPAMKLYGRLGFKQFCGPNQDGYLTLTIQNHA